MQRSECTIEEWEKYKSYQRRYYHSNKAKAAAIMRRYYESHKQQFIDRARRWRKSNPEKMKLIREKEKPKIYKWRREHKELVQSWVSKRKAIQLGAIIGDNAQIVELIQSIKTNRRTRCYYCGKSLYRKPFHMDHIVPLSRGGKHSIENLCVSCPMCNCKKGSRLISEWNRNGQQVFNL